MTTEETDYELSPTEIAIWKRARRMMQNRIRREETVDLTESDLQPKRQTLSYITAAQVKSAIDEVGIKKLLRPEQRKGVVIVELIKKGKRYRVCWPTISYIRHIMKCARTHTKLPETLIGAPTVKECLEEYRAKYEEPLWTPLPVTTKPPRKKAAYQLNGRPSPGIYHR